MDAELRDVIFKNIEWSQEDYFKGKGGQTVSMVRLDTVGYSPELNIRIMCGYHRSFFKNKEVILKMFGSVVDELIS